MSSPLTRNQWIGLGIMLTLIAVFIGSFYLIDHLNRPSGEVSATDAVSPEEISVLMEKQKQTEYLNFKHDTVALYLHKFDPNTADSTELLQLGLRPWMVRNMLKYRAKGGKWRTKEAVKKVYGMTDELYAQIEPYIEIVQNEDSTRVRQDTVFAMHYRQKKDTMLNLNTCDTAELKYIKGVGGGYARRIVRYRRELGGYVSAEQLRDIEEIPDETLDSIIPHFIVDSDSIRTINVNHASASMLQRHPYLSFSQAKAIYELRRTKFRLKDIDDLQELDCLTETEIERLAPYLSFEE